MTLHELQEQALKLPTEERLQLIHALMRSLQSKSSLTVGQSGLASRLIGIAKTDMPPPTDDELKEILAERRV